MRLTFDNKLRFKGHVLQLSQKAFGRLKILYGSRECLTTKLCKSVFTYGDVVYDFGDVQRMQHVQRVNVSDSFMVYGNLIPCCI